MPSLIGIIVLIKYGHIFRVFLLLILMIGSETLRQGLRILCDQGEADE